MPNMLEDLTKRFELTAGRPVEPFRAVRLRQVSHPRHALAPTGGVPESGSEETFKTFYDALDQHIIRVKECRSPRRAG
jgi:hypothetical protein